MFRKRRQRKEDFRDFCVDTHASVNNIDYMLQDLAYTLGYEWNVSKAKGNTPVEWGWTKVKKPANLGKLTYKAEVKRGKK